MIKHQTVDVYISTFPPSTAYKLKKIREIILKLAPQAIESISYGMPAYKINNKPLVYFGGFEKHIGFYAIPSAHDKFKDKLLNYKHGKGSVQFPLDEELPVELITNMIMFRLAETLKTTS